MQLGNLETLNEMSARILQEEADIKKMKIPTVQGTKPLKEDESLMNELIELFGEDVIMSDDMRQWININDPMTREEVEELVPIDSLIPEVEPTEEEIQAEFERMIEADKERVRLEELNRKKAQAASFIKEKLKERTELVCEQRDHTAQVERAKQQRQNNAQYAAKGLYREMLQREEQEAQEATARAQAEEELAAIEAKRKTLLQKIGLKK